MAQDKVTNQHLSLSSKTQRLDCYENDSLWRSFSISTGKNGMGELEGSGCTPRGWHTIYSKIGGDAPENAVFVSRVWTGEIYSPELALAHPGRDWILTRIIQLDGLEEGRNKGSNVDTLARYIYIHGTPDSTPLGIPGSKGCIRMRNHELIALFDWIEIGTTIFIE